MVGLVFFSLRILVCWVMYDFEQVSLEHLLLSLYPGYTPQIAKCWKNVPKPCDFRCWVAATTRCARSIWGPLIPPAATSSGRQALRCFGVPHQSLRKGRQKSFFLQDSGFQEWKQVQVPVLNEFTPSNTLVWFGVVCLGTREKFRDSGAQFAPVAARLLCINHPPLQ